MSSGRVAQCDDRDRVHHATQRSVDGGGVQAGEERPADHQPKPELHGATARTGARSEGVRRRGLGSGGTKELSPVPLEPPAEQRGGHPGLQRMNEARIHP